MFWYKVEFVNEFNDYENVAEEGLIGASSYAEAAQKLTEYVGGPEGLFSMYLTEMMNPLSLGELEEVAREYPEDK